MTSNFIVSVDLNGVVPTHAQMDEHMRRAGYGRDRILETVWHVKSNQSIEEVYSYINQILSYNDRLLVVEASAMMWRNLLVRNDRVQASWAA